MVLRWTPAALDDLDAAGRYLARLDPEASERTGLRVLEAVEGLVAFPSIGRPGRVAGTRELVVSATPFLVVYRVRRTQIQILRVLHHARRWPPR